MFSVISASAPSHGFHAPHFQVPGSLDPQRTMANDYANTSMPMPRHENMFTFGGDSDNEDDDPMSYHDTNMLMPQGLSPEDSALDMHGNYHWEAVA